MNSASGTSALHRLEWAGIAVAAGVAAFLLLRPLPGGPSALTSMPLLLLLAAWITADDWQHWTIPDGPVVALGILGAGWRLAVAEGTGHMLPEAAFLAADGLAWGGAFLLLREAHFRRRGFDGLGMGDVKLACACGILNGTAGFAWALLLASSAGLLVAAAARLRGRKTEKIPFGAFLAPASAAIWLAGWSG